MTLYELKYKTNQDLPIDPKYPESAVEICALSCEILQLLWPAIVSHSSVLFTLPSRHK